MTWLTMDFYGSLEVPPKVNFDWVIPDFVEWCQNCPRNELQHGPDFKMENGLVFGLGCHPNNDKFPDRIKFWLENRSPVGYKTSKVDKLAIGPVDEEGFEHEDCLVEDGDFEGEVYLDPKTADSEFEKETLTEHLTCFGQMRIRCRFEFEDAQEMSELKGNSNMSS